jgi:hypothetical protein
MVKVKEGFPIQREQAAVDMVTLHLSALKARPRATRRKEMQLEE